MSTSKRTDEELKKINESRLAKLDEVIFEGAKDQAADLLLDFDAAFEEVKAGSKPLSIKLDGVNYDIPHSMPADFWFYLTRECLVPFEGGWSINIPNEDMGLELLRRAVSDDFADAVTVSKKPISFIVERVFELISERWLGAIYKKKADQSPKQGTMIRD